MKLASQLKYWFVNWLLCKETCRLKDFILTQHLAIRVAIGLHPKAENRKTKRHDYYRLKEKEQ